MTSTTSAPATATRVLRLRLKDKHAGVLAGLAREVNFVWNFVNELSVKVFERERRFISSYELDKYLAGATKEGLHLHSQTPQAISAEYCKSRRQAKKVKLRWRVSRGSRRSLGWVPFKKSAIRYRNGQVWVSGIDKPLSLWDSYGLADYELGAGSISEDARGRWYLNLCVTVVTKPRDVALEATDALGVDLGLKDFMTPSTGAAVTAQRFYRDLEPQLAVAQRAGKKDRVRALHAKIANRRKDFLHQLSTAQVRQYRAIFVGNVNATWLTQTNAAKSVHDAGWSPYRTMLKTKSDDAGTWFKEIDESFTTQDCHVCGSRCGPKGRAELDVRDWTCAVCGTHHDRDVNAAQNIKARGLAWLEGQFAIADSAHTTSAAAVNKAGGCSHLPRSDMTV